MTVPVFVDSNVWVYKNSTTETWKATRARNWIETLQDTNDIWISYQVVVEFYNVVLRGAVSDEEALTAREDVRDLLTLQVIPYDDDLIFRAFAIEDRYRFSWWDCLIVAAALKAGCRYLLTEDMQHRQTLDGLIIIDPFQSEPAEILH
ncbi:MAG: PIN domain-containing protein [Rhizobiales bacterium]|nr:PIN domain-containing protein [Hyphomicrobiales bacterium]